MEFAAVGAELDGPSCHRVLRADSAEEGPFTRRAVLQILDSAVLGVPAGETDLELRIREIAGEALVPLQQRAVAGRGIHPVDIEVTLVPSVVRDQQFAGKMGRDLLDVAPHPRTRGQRLYIAGLQINAPGAPVFIPGRLAEEHDMPIIMHPDDRGAEIAVGHRRHRARPVDPVDRGDPEIEHAADRRAERNPGAMRADPHNASLGISKNQAAGKQAGALFSDPYGIGRWVAHDPGPRVKWRD